MRGKRGAGAQFLFELLLATVVFFLFLIALFAFVGPQITLKAYGTVIGVDSQLNCKLGLLSVARQDTNLVLESYTSNKFDELKAKTTELFDYVYGKDDEGNDKWFVSVRTASDTIIDASKVGYEAPDRVRCDLLMPLPAYEFNRGCGFIHVEELDTPLLGRLTYPVVTPDGQRDCFLTNERVTIGTAPRFAIDQCVDQDEFRKENFVGGVPLPQAQSADTSVVDYNDSAEFITVPINIDGNIYHLTMEESFADTDEEPGRNRVTLTVRKKLVTGECSVHLVGEIENTSPLQTFAGFKESEAAQ